MAKEKNLEEESLEEESLEERVEKLEKENSKQWIIISIINITVMLLVIFI